MSLHVYRVCACVYVYIYIGTHGVWYACTNDGIGGILGVEAADSTAPENATAGSIDAIFASALASTRRARAQAVGEGSQTGEYSNKPHTGEGNSLAWRQVCLVCVLCVRGWLRGCVRVCL